MRDSRATALLKLAIAGSVAWLSGAFAEANAQQWRIERRDGVETVRFSRPDGLELLFQCRRGGSRPGTGGFRIALPSGLFARIPASDDLIRMRFSSGPEAVELALAARAEEIAPPRRRGAPAAKIEAIAFAFRQPGNAGDAATLARLAALFADRRARQVVVEAKEIALALRLPAGAERELAGLKQGCADGIPDPDDDVQGPWHHGVSSSDGETVVILTTSADRGPYESAPEAKLVIACEHGDIALRLATPGRPLAPLRARLRTKNGEQAIQFAAAPAPEELVADRADAAAARRLLLGVEEAELSFGAPDPPETLRFDVFGLDFAARKMRGLCKDF